MKAKMNDTQIKALIRENKEGKYAVGHGLYLRISKQGSPFWIVRYTINKKRREITIGRYGINPNELRMAKAMEKAISIKASLVDGIDPIAEKKRSSSKSILTVNELAEDWLTKDIEPRLKHPQIPRRIFKKEISPSIGELQLERVTTLDIRAILEKIALSNRPSISNDALMYSKQLFTHAISLGLMQSNPAASLSIKHAGGIELSRDRALSAEEIKKLFPVLIENKDSFSRENFIAICLLLMLGVRKNELLTEKWESISFKEQVWYLKRDENKKGGSIDIPLPTQAIVLLEELKLRACGSDYIFPNRRASKRFGHVSPDTLNHALAKLFGKKVSSGRESINVFAEHGIEHFTVHDLRRTCRTLLAQLGVEAHIAERCLNHKLKGIESVYNRHDYFEERKLALQKLADYLYTFTLSNSSHQQ
ncbi:tyrosine-type recombinase/integrase [Vibrio alginolyticus]